MQAELSPDAVVLRPCERAADQAGGESQFAEQRRVGDALVAPRSASEQAARVGAKCASN